MAARRKRLTYSPPRQPKPKVPDGAKTEVEAKAREIIDAVLKPDHIKPPSEDERFNYVVDIYTKWHRNYFYFCSQYRCPGRMPYRLFLRRGSLVWNTLPMTTTTCRT